MRFNISSRGFNDSFFRFDYNKKQAILVREHALLLCIHRRLLHTVFITLFQITRNQRESSCNKSVSFCRGWCDYIFLQTFY